MLKLITANIEGDRHVDRVQPFLLAQQAHVVCIQEVFEQDLTLLCGGDYSFQFLPMCLKQHRSGGLLPWGAAIASRLAVTKTASIYYHRATEQLVAFDARDKRQTIWHGLLKVDVADGDRLLTLITTHFTWTPNGVSDANQDADMPVMLKLLSQEPPHVLCGDFNIPRRQNLHYASLAQHYTDHIPQDIDSSVYVPLHYAAGNPEVAARLSQYMVDYILSTPQHYRIDHVTRHGGLSDHYVFSAEVCAV